MKGDRGRSSIVVGRMFAWITVLGDKRYGVKLISPRNPNRNSPADRNGRQAVHPRKRQLFGWLFGGIAVQLICSPAAAVDLTGSLRLHDPSRIQKQGNRYYTFATGSASAPIASKYSDNFTTWQNGPAVFSGIPAWAQAEVPNNPGFMWAPDVFYFNGQYRLVLLALVIRQPELRHRHGDKCDARFCRLRTTSG